MSLLLRTTAVAILLSTFPFANGVYAEETDRYRYGVSGNNLVFKTTQQAQEGGSFRLSVKNGRPGSIRVALVDVYANSSGIKKSIPLGSSPFTPEKLVEFTESYPGYVPNGDYQYFDISFRFKDDVKIDRPVLGGLSISIVPNQDAADTTGGNSVRSSIVATFAYLPDSGLNLAEYAPALTLEGPIFQRITNDFFPLNLIPDPPFLLNYGDLEASYTLTNSGKIFLETTTELQVKKLGIAFGQAARDKQSVFRYQSKQLFLVPGQQASERFEIKTEDTESSGLGIGIYSFTTVATGDLGDQITTSTTNQQILVIFPWKQTFLALLVLVLFRKRISKAFKWLVNYGKSLKEFQKSRKQGFPETPKPFVLNQTPGKTQPLAPKSYSSNPRPLYPTWYEPPSKGSEFEGRSEKL